MGLKKKLPVMGSSSVLAESRPQDSCKDRCCCCLLCRKIGVATGITVVFSEHIR